MKSVEVVAAIIAEESDGLRIAATQRGYGDLIGKWEFPGGKIEPGESQEQALAREIREELGAAITIEDILMTVNYDYPTFHLVMHCFICTTHEKLVLLEHQSLKWCTIKELDELDWCPADVEVVRSIRDYFDKKS